MAARRLSPFELLISIGLICLLLMLPLSNGGGTSFARAMLAAGVFSLISLVLISPHKNVFLQMLPLRWLALVVLLVGASLFTSIFKDFSVKEALTLSSIIGGSILAGHVAGQGRDRPILVALLASGVIASLLAIPAYLSAPSGSQAASALSGSFHYPNGLGSFLLLMCFLPFPLIFHGGALPRALGSALALPVLGAALILTHSRGAWGAAMIALAFWAIMEWRLIWAHRRRMALAMILIVSLVFITSRRPADIAPRLVSLTAATSKESHDPSFRWRREIYAWTLDIIKDHPLTGTGIGTFPIAIKLYQQVPYVTGFYAHSHYLQIAAEMGLPALAGLLLFLGFLFWRGGRIIASLEPQSRERSLALGLAAGLLGSSLHATVDFGWSYPAVALVFGVEAAILFTLTSRSLPVAECGIPARTGLGALRLLLLSLCLVMAALAGTRYYAEWLRNEGNLALDVGERERAIGAFQWSTRLNPLYYSPRQLLASAYAAQGDMSSSQREAEAAFRLNPFDGDSYHELARIHWLAGQHGKAESEFLSAVRLQAYTRPIFYYDLGEFYLAMGKPSEAETWFAKGIKVFTPEMVTNRINRCLAPGDRYILARMYWKLAEKWGGEGRIADRKRGEEMAVRLSRPAMDEICFRGLKGRFVSPESAIVAHWQSRLQRDWPAVSATFAQEASQWLKEQSLLSLSPDIETVEVDWIVSLVGNENAARVGYEVKLLTRDEQVRRVAFTDTLVVEDGDWRVRQRQIGLK